jgi:hypothetical protein
MCASQSGQTNHWLCRSVIFATLCIPGYSICIYLAKKIVVKYFNAANLTYVMYF